LGVDLAFEKNTSFNFGVSMWRWDLLAQNRPLLLRWRKTCISQRETTVLEA
jgi:hypothetical protein